MTSQGKSALMALAIGLVVGYFADVSMSSIKCEQR
jgi:hypothetical protein